ncbi:MAG: hypothetical protein QW230_00815 [Thermofilum sp.]
MDRVVSFIQAQLKELESKIAEAEEIIRLAKLMGIDVTQQELELQRYKEQYARLKAGLEQYVRAKQLGAK